LLGTKGYVVVVVEIGHEIESLIITRCWDTSFLTNQIFTWKKAQQQEHVFLSL
jgi:hypothetical protein